MKLRSISLPLILLLFLFIAQSCVSKAQTPQIKILGTTVPSEQKAVSLKSLHIEVQVYGNIATTVMTMSFVNTSSRVLEGELTFPMPDGVSISGYALDINGKLREAVPVEKAKATEVFESIEHRRVDPGLLEKVEGNNFRTRIYPFPAGGSRTVKITYEEELHFSPQQQLSYRLPLDYKNAIPEFSLKVSVLESSQQPLLAEQPDGSFSFKNKGTAFIAEMQRKDFLPAHGLVINLPASGDQTTALMQKAGQSYYFLTNVLVNAPSRTHRWSNQIGLIWDVSLSGLKRDTAKELALLDAFIKERKNLTIQLGLLNNTFSKAGVFVIKDGNWKELREKLIHLVYDGGTDYTRINSNLLKADEYLFFTDGFSGFGNSSVSLSKPIYTINSSLAADFSTLKYISARTGGQFINLNVLSLESALQQISKDEMQFIGVKNNPGISELYPALPVRVNGYLSVAGIAASGAENLVLQFGYGNEVILERKVSLNAASQSAGVIDVSKIWAQKKLSDMDVHYEQNKKKISELGKQFGLVTRNTSLLVLESVDDYIRYGIEPPEELRTAYYKGMKGRIQEKEERKEGLMKEAIAMAAELKIWWNKVFKPEKFFPKPDKSGSPVTSPVAAAYNQNQVSDEMISLNRSADRRERAESSQMLYETVVSSSAQMSKLNGKITGVTISQPIAEQPVIIIPEFKSDKEYMKKIDGSAEHAYQQYLTIRKEYLTTPSFYLDISNWFQQHQDADRALMILSNLTELELENAEIYKTLTYKLRETGNIQTELFTSRKVLEWRPMDAQSYRDYALALADGGHYQSALDTLYTVLNQSYSMDNAERDHGIEEIILAEINNLINLHRAKLNISKIDKKVIFNFPVDVRVVMNWNKKDTDIDLWVTDPDGEKCFYSNNRTKAGGRISDDFTSGYGPEQFMIKKAIKGRYKIEVNYYGDSQLSISGPATVMAEIYTHYGSTNQERKIIALQLSGEQKGGVFIGEFTF
jgi:Ca-activated chloride channel family protein